MRGPGSENSEPGLWWVNFALSGLPTFSCVPSGTTDHFRGMVSISPLRACALTSFGVFSARGGDVI
jgi:hypothetical protein